MMINESRKSRTNVGKNLAIHNDHGNRLKVFFLGGGGVGVHLYPPIIRNVSACLDAFRN